MRHAGSVDREDHAQRFGDYLLTQGVKNRIDKEDDHWAIWVYDEDQLETAKDELEWFLGNPADPIYDAEIKAAAIRREQARQEAAARKNIVRVRDHWSKPQRGPLTTGLIIACVIVGILTMFGKKRDPFVYALSISHYTPTDDGNVLFPKDRFADVKQGQVWRLVTPIFLHFGMLHLVMNMFALYYFGNFIESRRGPIVLGVMVLLLAIFSNIMQYQFSPGQSPMFGGMSGVIYGLFGYLWIKTLADPTAGMNLQPTTIFIMMFFFVICLTGMMGPIANVAHAAGLGGGAVLALVSTFVNEVPRK
ncbi:MAG: rhomboid family intramembrane serine protease [Pirellulales bacterium]|nr:rhomboid family intramembrane serine protease [Pirellulales bacterium]